MRKPTTKELAAALDECIGAINDELRAAGADEVDQHATLRAHEKIAQKSRRLLERLRASDREDVTP
jgi:hypothetical protein